MNIQRVKLIYYSPTGTSKKTVKAIQSGIGIDYDTIDLTLPDSQLKQYSLKDTDLAIIAVPVYSGRVAPTAAQRVAKIKGQNTPSVLVAVYGNRAFEDALVELRDLTEPNGFKAIAAGAFIGEHSFDAPDTPIATGRPDAEDLEKAKDFGAKVKAKVAEMKNEATCTLCGICAQVCPTGCITVTDVVETEIDNCTACAACVKNCPTDARYWEHEGILKAAKWLATEHGARKEPETFL